MNEFGRVAVCGAISTYNQDQEEQPKGDHNKYYIMVKGRHLIIYAKEYKLHVCYVLYKCSMLLLQIFVLEH